MAGGFLTTGSPGKPRSNQLKYHGCLFKNFGIRTFYFTSAFLFSQVYVCVLPFLEDYSENNYHRSGRKIGDLIVYMA